jgi:hypothetical protein
MGLIAATADSTARGVGTVSERATQETRVTMVQKIVRKTAKTVQWTMRKGRVLYPCPVLRSDYMSEVEGAWKTWCSTV